MIKRPAPLDGSVARRPRMSAGMARAGIACGLVLTITSIATACGSDTESPVAVRIGHATISERSVIHWAKALVTGGLVQPFTSRAALTPKQVALDFLISSDWLISEAADRGAPVLERSVRQRLQELRVAVPAGESAFAESLKGYGRTIGDVELEIRTELATTAIRRILANARVSVSSSAIRAYYRTYQHRFRVPEVRDIDIVEGLRSRAAASRLAARVRAGADFARAGSFHEARRRPERFDLRSEIGLLAHAIFGSTPGVLVGPMRLDKAWTLFVVRRVLPPSTKPLKAVRRRIAELLAVRHRAEARTSFVEAYRTRWRARTSCSIGFVIAKCAQYRGAPVSEEPSFAVS